MISDNRLLYIAKSDSTDHLAGGCVERSEVRASKLANDWQAPQKRSRTDFNSHMVASFPEPLSVWRFNGAATTLIMSQGSRILRQACSILLVNSDSIIIIILLIYSHSKRRLRGFHMPPSGPLRRDLISYLLSAAQPPFHPPDGTHTGWECLCQTNPVKYMR